MRLLLLAIGGTKPLIHCLAIAAVLVSANLSCAQSGTSKVLDPESQQRSSNQEVERATLAFKKGDYKSARDLLMAARVKHPELAPADVMMAILYFSAGKKDEGVAAIEAATVHAASDPEAYIILADLALRSGQKAYAKLAYQKAQSLLKGFKRNPQRLPQFKVRIEAGLASLCEARGQFSLAAEHLRAWKKLSPQDPIPVGSLGRVLFHLREYDQARAAFRELASIDQAAPPVDIAMGRLYADAGMQDEALKSMTAAVKRGENDIRVRLSVAEWALQSGKVDLAQSCIDKALEIEKDSRTAQVLAARLARLLGEPERAEAILKGAVLSTPNHFAITNEYARTLASSADAEKRKSGLKYAEHNFQVHKNRATRAGLEATVTYAWLLLCNGQSERAEAALHALPNKSSISSENAFYAAQIYLQNGKQDLALNALRATLSSNTAFPGKGKAEELRAKLAAQKTKP